MNTTSSLKRWLILGASLLSMAAAAQAPYPHGPLKFIIPFSAGSSTDTFARAAAKHISVQFGQPIVVENVPGAQGQIAATKVAKAPPDGYTVFVTSTTTHAANASMYKKLSYDPVADFEPVAKLATLSLAMIVHPSVPARNVQEFITYAKANPGKVTFGSGASSSRIAGELLKIRTGIDMLHVPYKSNPEAVLGLISGQVSVVISDLTVTMPQARSGKARALALGGSKRSPLAPELPTMNEAGVANYELDAWLAAFVPAKTPPAVIEKLNLAFKTALEDPEIIAVLNRAGIVPSYSTPQELRTFAASETAKWAEIVKTSGMQPE
jgi:tripartite-type tricarboxylate transporter receptor subunit TctC